MAGVHTVIDVPCLSWPAFVRVLSPEATSMEITGMVTHEMRLTVRQRSTIKSIAGLFVMYRAAGFSLRSKSNLRFSYHNTEVLHTVLYCTYN